GSAPAPCRAASSTGAAGVRRAVRRAAPRAVLAAAAGRSPRPGTARPGAVRRGARRPRATARTLRGRTGRSCAATGCTTGRPAPLAFLLPPLEFVEIVGVDHVREHIEVIEALRLVVGPGAGGRLDLLGVGAHDRLVQLDAGLAVDRVREIRVQPGAAALVARR